MFAEDIYIVASKKNEGYHKLTDTDEFALIVEAVLLNHSVYLKSIRSHVYKLLVHQYY